MSKGIAETMEYEATELFDTRGRPIPKGIIWKEISI
jgi:hypothetical protein